MSEDVEVPVNAESVGSIESKDDNEEAVIEEPPPVGDDTAGEPAAPTADDSAGLHLVLLFQS